MGNMMWAKFLITCLACQFIGSSAAIPVQDSEDLESTIRHKKSVVLEVSENCGKSAKSPFGLSLAFSVSLSAVKNTLSAIGGFLSSAIKSHHGYGHHDHYRKRRDVIEAVDNLSPRLDGNTSNETPATDILVQSNTFKQYNQPGKNIKETKNAKAKRRIDFVKDDKSSTAGISNNVKDSSTTETGYNYSFTPEDMRIVAERSET